MDYILEFFTPIIQAILHLLFGQEVASFEDMQAFKYAISDPT
jgi:hypothetical protein